MPMNGKFTYSEAILNHTKLLNLLSTLFLLIYVCKSTSIEWQEDLSCDLRHWEDTGNWIGGIVPGIDDVALISTTHCQILRIQATTDIILKGIVIGRGVKIQIENHDLTLGKNGAVVSGSLYLSDGSLYGPTNYTVFGSLTVDGHTNVMLRGVLTIYGNFTLYHTKLLSDTQIIVYGNMSFTSRLALLTAESEKWTWEGKSSLIIENQLFVNTIGPEITYRTRYESIWTCNGVCNIINNGVITASQEKMSLIVRISSRHSTRSVIRLIDTARVALYDAVIEGSVKSANNTELTLYENVVVQKSANLSILGLANFGLDASAENELPKFIGNHNVTLVHSLYVQVDGVLGIDRLTGDGSKVYGGDRCSVFVENGVVVNGKRIENCVVGIGQGAEWQQSSDLTIEGEKSGVTVYGNGILSGVVECSEESSGVFVHATLFITNNALSTPLHIYGHLHLPSSSTLTKTLSLYSGTLHTPLQLTFGKMVVFGDSRVVGTGSIKGGDVVVNGNLDLDGLTGPQYCVLSFSTMYSKGHVNVGQYGKIECEGCNVAGIGKVIVNGVRSEVVVSSGMAIGCGIDVEESGRMVWNSGMVTLNSIVNVKGTLSVEGSSVKMETNSSLVVQDGGDMGVVADLDIANNGAMVLTRHATLNLLNSVLSIHGGLDCDATLSIFNSRIRLYPTLPHTLHSHTYTPNGGEFEVYGDLIIKNLATLSAIKLVNHGKVSGTGEIAPSSTLVWGNGGVWSGFDLALHDYSIGGGKVVDGGRVKVTGNVDVNGELYVCQSCYLLNSGHLKVMHNVVGQAKIVNYNTILVNASISMEAEITNYGNFEILGKMILKGVINSHGFLRVDGEVQGRYGRTEQYNGVVCGRGAIGNFLLLNGGELRTNCDVPYSTFFIYQLNYTHGLMKIRIGGLDKHDIYSTYHCIATNIALVLVWNNVNSIPMDTEIMIMESTYVLISYHNVDMAIQNIGIAPNAIKMRKTLSQLFVSITGCPTGTDGDLQACRPCSAGQYSNGTGCHVCPMGTYSNGEGNTECLGCGAGYYTNETACIPCPMGHHCNYTYPIPCPVGTYSNRIGGVECLECSEGWYSAVNGTVDCTLCPAGYNSSQGASNCTLIEWPTTEHAESSSATTPVTTFTISILLFFGCCGCGLCGAFAYSRRRKRERNYTEITEIRVDDHLLDRITRLRDIMKRQITVFEGIRENS